MHSPLVLGLLTALLAAPSSQGQATSCYQCKTKGISICALSPQACGSAQDACLSLWEENTLVKGWAVNSGTFQSCVPFTVSDRNISLFFGTGLYVHIQSQVCKTSDCNNNIQQKRPTINQVYNGGRCPACFGPGWDSCSINETLQCKGRANRCISIRGRISEDDIIIPFAAKGCATPHACTLETGVTLDSGVFSYEITQVECSLPSGTEPRQGPLVLASVAGLLAVKFLS